MKICHQVHRWRNWGRSRGSKSVCSHSVTLIPFLTLTCISLEWKQFHWLSRVFSFYTSLSSSQQMHCSSTRALWLWITVCLCQVLHKTNWKSWTKTDFLVPRVCSGDEGACLCVGRGNCAWRTWICYYPVWDPEIWRPWSLGWVFFHVECTCCILVTEPREEHTDWATSSKLSNFPFSIRGRDL